MIDPDPDPGAAVLFTRYRRSLIETFPSVFLRWEHLADHPHGPLANVRLLSSTFDAAHPRTTRRLLTGSERRLPAYAQAYAQTEVGATTIGFRTRHAAGPTDDARHVNRQALALSRARLLDLHSGRPVRRPDRIGRIDARGPGLFAGYLDQGQHTTSPQRECGPDTGDVGSRTLTAGLPLAGRAVDAVSGMDDPLAVERRLLDRLPEPTEVILPTLPGQNTPVTVVCTRADIPLDRGRWRAAIADLPLPALPPTSHCRPFPRQWRWDQLPTTATWKVRRAALQLLLIADPATPTRILS